jgi:hypothetical protein
MLQEGLDRPAKHGLSGEEAELLGKPAAHARTATRGDDECSDCQKPFALSLSKGCL